MAKDQDHPKGITRKDFVKGALAGAFLLGAAGSLPGFAAFDPKKKSLVAIARGANLINANGDYLGPQVQTVVDRAIAKALQAPNAVEGLRKIISPSDTVGLKVNCIAGYSLCTRPEVAYAIAQRVYDLGVPSERIIIWDRTDAELINCRYRLQKAPGGVQVYGTKPGVGYTDAPVPGGAKADHISKILTEQCTKLINVPVMKTHGGAGVSLALKNHLGTDQNPGSYHDDSCIAVGDLNASQPIKDKTVLVVCDAIRPLYKDGPGDNPAFRWDYNGILASTDPVAHDRVGYEVMAKQWRTLHGTEGWGHEQGLKHILRAAELGLGHGDLGMIQIVEA